MILTLVEITDFRSIKGTIKLDFDRKITILLGSNDHGKTNILKAVEHLNDGAVITEEETNWDADGSPASGRPSGPPAARRPRGTSHTTIPAATA